jgi:ubiquinone/menaquinone biosynthesis C-methylase UbiE
MNERRMPDARAARLRRQWDRRTTRWDHDVFASPAFALLRERLLVAAAPENHDRCVDLGAGTGFLTLALAPQVSFTVAVDISPDMLAVLRGRARQCRVHDVSAIVADIARFELAPNSVDLVVSSYALHHLTDRQKADLLRRVRTWLRPGGRIVIADMMFGRGSSRRDRKILRAKVARMLRKGPGGLLRIAKNIGRFGLRIGSDRPVPPEFWMAAMRDAGFIDIEQEPVVAEACVVFGRTPTCLDATESGG